MIRLLVSMVFALLFSFLACKQNLNSGEQNKQISPSATGPLIGTRYASFAALKKDIKLTYIKEGKFKVLLEQSHKGKNIYSVLESGVTEKDFEKAQQGNFFDKVSLAMKCPYLLLCRNDVFRVYLLSRRKGEYFGEGDMSFYDIAETMMAHINKEDQDSLFTKDFTEKGYINTFNHLAAQALITIIFSERLADFIADAHELGRMPELATGEFSKSQIENLANGPLDNYVDIINNEWGQEIGKELVKKYGFNRETVWQAKELAIILNEIQAFCSWTFKVGFDPFLEEDELIVKFAKKINLVLADLKAYR